MCREGHVSLLWPLWCVCHTVNFQQMYMEFENEWTPTVMVCALWSQLRVQRLMLGSYRLCEWAFTQIVFSSVLLPWAQNWRGVAYWQAWLRIDVRRGKKWRKGDLKQLEYSGRVDFYYSYSLNRYALSSYNIHYSRPWGYSSEQSPALVELAFQIGV